MNRLKSAEFSPQAQYASPRLRTEVRAPTSPVHRMPAGGGSSINPGGAHFAVTVGALSSLSLSAAAFAWMG